MPRRGAASVGSCGPEFDVRAQDAPSLETWLWLDVEEHAEFIGAYQPPDLPMLIAYEGTQIRCAKSLDPSCETLDSVLAREGTGRPVDPEIRARLTRIDWAT